MASGVSKEGGKGSGVAIDCGASAFTTRIVWCFQKVESFFGDEFGCDMNEGVGAEAGAPVVEMVEGVFCGADVFEHAVGDVLVEEL